MFETAPGEYITPMNFEWTLKKVRKQLTATHCYGVSDNFLMQLL